MDHLTRRGLLTLTSAAALWSVLEGSAWAADPPDDGTWSTHPTWPVLKKTRLTTDQRGMVHATMAPEVLAMAGKPLSISGFILPIEAGAASKHFILSRYSPECPFCPAGAPNEVIEVFSDKPVRPFESMVYLKGRFEVQNNVEAGLFYRMENADLG